MTKLHDTGFTPPADIVRVGRHEAPAIAALVMVAALAFGTLAAATAVTIGLTRGGDTSPPGVKAYASTWPQMPHRG